MPARERARRLFAAASLVAALRAVEDRGSNMVAEALGGAEFVAGYHYPADDRIDPATGAQYYFHAHDPTDPRPDDGCQRAIGHLHVFIRPEGPGADKPIHHLIAIALDRAGRPVRLFTTNRWVTGENFCAAPAARAFVRRFEIADPSPLDQFVTAMLTLFRADIAVLLADRDAAIGAWQAARPTTDAYEDRDLEITSSLPVDLPAVLAGMQAYTNGHNE